tara:strand:- start:67 stop:411 length:345 start_codon:yes stop_codon:yes gene_type:complete
MSNNKTWYTGIADSEGIESFTPLEELSSQDRAIMSIRAAANPQRFAVVYKAELDDETATNVKRWLVEGNWINGLKALGNGIQNNNLESKATNRKYWNLLTKHFNTLNKITKEQE